MATLTELDLLPHLRDHLTEALHFFGVLLQQMQHQPQCRLLPDARQAREFVDSVFEQCGGELHPTKIGRELQAASYKLQGVSKNGS